MKKWLIFLLAGLTAALPAAAQDNTLELISTAQDDETVLIEVQADVSTNSYGFGLQLQYDPEYVQPVRREDFDGAEAFGQVGDIFEGAQRVINRDEEIENGLRQIDVVYTLLAPAEPVSGEGVLVSVLFEQVQPGASDIVLANPRLIQLTEGIASDVGVTVVATAVAIETNAEPAAEAQEPAVEVPSTASEAAPQPQTTTTDLGALMPWLIALVALQALIAVLLVILVIVILVRIPTSTPIIVDSGSVQYGTSKSNPATLR